MEEPTVKALPARTVIAMDHHGSYDDIGGVYRALHRWAGEHGVTPTGKGLTVFVDPPERFDPRSARFEVCLPVEGAVEGDAEVTVKELPACEVASVTVTGPYGEIPAHYTEMLAWLDYRGWQVGGQPREVYRKRPAGAGAPGDYETEIQFPIKR
jgi:effector-binding domain-containing protein